MKQSKEGAREFKKAVELIGEGINLEATENKIKEKYKIFGEYKYRGSLIRDMGGGVFQVFDSGGIALSKKFNSEATARDYIDHFKTLKRPLGPVGFGA